MSNPTKERNKEDPLLPFLRLSQWINSHLGDADEGIVKDIKLAEMIEAVSRDTHLCHIQWNDWNGDKLRYPKLWRYHVWAASSARWEASKKRAEEERIERFILQANIESIVKDSVKSTSKLWLDEDAAKEVATILMRQYPRRKCLLDFWFTDVKIITRKEEL